MISTRKHWMIIVVLGIIGCTSKKELKRSEFKVAESYTDFANKMENNDTLNIDVLLSICKWQEYHRIEVTKRNDSVYLQVKEKRVMMDEPKCFSKVLYKLKNDTLNLEKMMMGFEINNTNSRNSPFFIVTNPKESDTVLLRTTGLENRTINIEKYRLIMSELYPNEMKYEPEECIVVPPPPKNSNEEILDQ